MQIKFDDNVKVISGSKSDLIREFLNKIPEDIAYTYIELAEQFRVDPHTIADVAKHSNATIRILTGSGKTLTVVVNPATAKKRKQNDKSK